MKFITKHWNKLSEGTRDRILYISGGLIGLFIISYFMWYSFTH